jgi:hypothetical protein
MVSCHTADSKSVKQEFNGTVILPPLVFPAQIFFGPKILKRDEHSSLFVCNFSDKEKSFMALT